VSWLSLLQLDKSIPEQTKGNPEKEGREGRPTSTAAPREHWDTRLFPSICHLNRDSQRGKATEAVPVALVEGQVSRCRMRIED
jgi:hypothetical protein